MIATDIVSPKVWLEHRLRLLREEKKLTRQQDRVAAMRRDLPTVEVTTSYEFDDVSGTFSLADLFGFQDQLVIYHFMFAESWDEGCKHCSYWADSFDGVSAHLRARNTAFVCVSAAPLEKLLDYRNRMGWSFRWVSSLGPSFGQDFGVSPGGDRKLGYNYSDRQLSMEMPGLSVFVRTDEGSILHCYSTFARGLEPLNAAYGILDLTKMGRNEDGTGRPMAWVQRHDSYGEV